MNNIKIFEPNQIVSMTLNMTEHKNNYGFATLSFKVDNEDLGIAFDSIDIRKEYIMAISVFHPCSIQLLQ